MARRLTQFMMDDTLDVEEDEYDYTYEDDDGEIDQDADIENKYYNAKCT